MLPPLADLEALAARLGVSDLIGLDAGRGQAALDDASALIRQEADATWVDDEGQLEDVPDAVASICLAVAYRAYRNPEGTVQASLGDASVTYARTGGGSAIYLTDYEIKALRRVAGRSAVLSVGYATPYYDRAVPAPGDEWWEVYD
ncbi:MAG: hypothetical protein M0R75_14035 [Dehalococcoidia bacterium]|nr:hypothetical protein [Dehalococcoidia bacterium]